MINHSQGLFIKEGNAYTKYYHINDHLGNTRVVYSDKNNDGAVQYHTEVGQSTQYYPFGLEHNVEAYSKASKNDYLYNGVRQESAWDLNWSVTPYRTYDKSIARWLQIDPKAEASAHVSPYVAMDNNPISMADPMGDIPTGRPSMMDHLAHIGLGILYNWLGASPGDGNPSTVSGSMRGNWFPMPEQVVLTDWYRDPKTGEEFWTPDRGAVEGLDWLGENHTVKGKYGSVYHEQNVVISSDINSRMIPNFKLGSDLFSALAVGSGIKNEIINFAIRDYHGLNRTSFSKLSNSTKSLNEMAVLGKTGVKYLKYAKGLGAVGNIVGVASASIQLIEKPTIGNGTRLALQGIAIGAAFIPGVGWGIALGITAVDLFYGERIYNYLDNK